MLPDSWQHLAQKSARIQVYSSDHLNRERIKRENKKESSYLYFKFLFGIIQQTISYVKNFLIPTTNS
jgi:hypothetical protein